MSPLLKNIFALAVAFSLGELLLSMSRFKGHTFPEILQRAMPRLAFAVTAGAVVGMILHLAGIQVAP
jgi:hypothetical protein